MNLLDRVARRITVPNLEEKMAMAKQQLDLMSLVAHKYQISLTEVVRIVEELPKITAQTQLFLPDNFESLSHEEKVAWEFIDEWNLATAEED